MTFVTNTPLASSNEGVPLAQVRDLLGHASITRTERYDNQRLETLQIAGIEARARHDFRAASTCAAAGADAATAK